MASVVQVMKGPTYGRKRARPASTAIAERVANPQDAHHDNVREGGQQEDHNLPAKERVPDLAEFHTDPAGIFRVAGNLETQHPAAQTSALRKNEIRNEQDEERPSEELRRAAGEGGDKIAGPAEQRLDDAKQLAAQLRQIHVPEVDLERAELVNLARQIGDQRRKRGQVSLHNGDQAFDLLHQPQSAERQHAHQEQQQDDVDYGDGNRPRDVQPLLQGARHGMQQIGQYERH